eukprot:CAMPEP_0177696812 /NCGR_PEP_ID=MMETSP0484_2-20121128/4179_1 /TAXON_ID=354590 /ORGANISM="Rhodomonas lens, Strain RHODO" /LENGTH=94 /DNA_ID=CAMNT_0019207807 /DNA_START=135 /DNA_END=416 /DNA_ORIENTATION=+
MASRSLMRAAPCFLPSFFPRLRAPGSAWNSFGSCKSQSPKHAIVLLHLSTVSTLLPLKSSRAPLAAPNFAQSAFMGRAKTQQIRSMASNARTEN